MLILYLIIIILVIILAIATVIAWGQQTRKPPNTGPATRKAPVGYLSRCVTNPTVDNNFTYIPIPGVCDTGLVCSKVSSSDPWGFCKRAIGQPCTSLAECESKAVDCSRVCTTSTTGGLDQNCNPDGTCNDQYVCTSNGTCKVSLGNSGCYESFDCAPVTGYKDAVRCVVGTCVVPQGNGGRCSRPEDCSSNNCDAGWCQPVGIRNGELGAGCGFYTGSEPECKGDNLTCTKSSNMVSNLGVCAFKPNKWDSGRCTTGYGCIHPTLCTNGQCQMPISQSLYLTNSCASQDSTGVCIHGYSCVDNQCSPDNTVSVPSNSRSALPGFFKWDTSNAGEIGRWVNNGQNQGPLSQISSLSTNAKLSVISNPTVARGNPAISQLALLTQGDEVYLVRDGTEYKISVSGPYNGTTLLNVIPERGFRFDFARFTPNHNIIWFYSWIKVSDGSSMRVSRGQILAIPPTWLDKNATPEPIQYQITWPGRVPNQNITPESKQNTEGAYNSIVYAGGTPNVPSPSGSVTIDLPEVVEFDVDDRNNSAGKHRFLLITVDGWIVRGFSDLPDFNSTAYRFSTPVSNIFAREARFYTYQKGYHDTFAFGWVQLTPNTSLVQFPPGKVVFEATNTQDIPSIVLPPSDIPADTAKMSMFAIQGGGIANTSLAYLIDAGPNGGYQLGLYRSFNKILPGYFGAHTSIAVSIPNPAIQTDLSNQDLYVVTYGTKA